MLRIVARFITIRGIMFFSYHYISMIEEYQCGIGEIADSMTFPREKQGHGLLRTFGDTRDIVCIMLR